MIIDGKAIAAQRAEILRNKIQVLSKAPKLAIVLVGDDPASKTYANLKLKKARELGIDAEIRKDLNTDADGIIVQLPGGENLIKDIPPEKDVDGLTGKSKFLPATVKGIVTLLNGYIAKNFNSVAIQQCNNVTVVVVGQGRLVGKPLADYLEKRNYKVIRGDINTPDLKSETLKGDILVVATGVPNLIKADMVKPRAVVIDCGSPKAEVDFEKVKDVAGAITPVPGGVGPLTVISLLENVVEAAGS
ncbi:bifunctional 5,10-methylenetetrahydrofolate dehydrogenase/5,10-methenyltetrahydrofolate cyclohydrolase [Patescibacteria group bacterium]|nr:bifunctional 5,10-methylenetetrahydrofolate dehydrogenase/5,10-methenyltetrahydrofolate cyclohydrolase [Patescibacteria group bacterium]